MLGFFRWAGAALSVLTVVAVAAIFLGPVEKVDLSFDFDDAKIGADLDAWLDEQEQWIPGITPRTEKHVVWAGVKGEKTAVSIVYLHGFSGSAVDIDPVPERIADAIGANVFYSRLTGHGLDGASLGAASPDSWLEDTAEAIAIGRRLGDQILIIGTSTGGTLATIAAVDPILSKDIFGVVLVSPNYRLKSAQAKIFDLGFVPVWAPLLTGPEYSRRPTSQDHATYWTTRYPVSALFNLATLMRAARTIDVSTGKIPMVVLYATDDQVVDADFTESFLQDWGGPVRWETFTMTDQDDPSSHMIVGDIRSPTQSTLAIETILDWYGELGR
ncbi:MAG: alpha/beta fold hydrolase [Tateyamaria sp.]|uniref:alpha/beta hydrolase n=1 Tax=Tateyamaria sp. TaxID=1929288 RepID=UPI00326F8788